MDTTQSDTVKHPLLDQLWQGIQGQEKLLVYGLLDGARSPRIHSNLIASGERFECLYAGELPRPLAVAAPYLVRLPLAQPFTQWLLASGWGRAWGLLLLSEASILELRAHFRRLLKVKTDDGRECLFRFYDPRVLRVYLPTCTPKELATVFGPVDGFMLEAENIRQGNAFHRRNSVLEQSTFDLIPPKKNETV